MFARVYAQLRTYGVAGLLSGLYRFTFPCVLEFFRKNQSLFLNRTGLEIGGPSGIFGRKGLMPIYQCAARIDNCNFGNHTIWEGGISAGNRFVFDNRRAPGYQYLIEASDLVDIASSSYDFVLASHCLEHLANPLQGLGEWIRVLKDKGLMVLVLPHRDHTFDHRRPVTTLGHLVQDLDSRTGEDDLTHLDEILMLHDLARDPGAGSVQAFQERSRRNLEYRCLHHHVFDARLAVEAVHYMKQQILAVEFCAPYHIVVFSQKPGRDESVDNEGFRAHR